jgi:hypothetical protein
MTLDRTALAGTRVSVKKLYLQTWGCQMNVRDSEEVVGLAGLIDLAFAYAFWLSWQKTGER